MKLNELIDMLAGEIEMSRPQLDQSLDELAGLDPEDASFMDVLDQYSSQAQRMGEAAELAGFEGLHLVCAHVVANTMLMAVLPLDQRESLLVFLRAWPELIVYYLNNLSDPTTAAELVNQLRGAPLPMEEDDALKVMHMLGAMPAQVALPGEGMGQPSRPVLATAADVELTLPTDVDEIILGGFFHEAPEQARQLVNLARKMVVGEGDNSDLVAAKRVAHTLKGSGAIVGLRGLASLSHHLEDILEHFEMNAGVVSKPAADALLDAAYCVEQMIGYVAGTDNYPQQAQGVLQTVLDLANRIDRGESIDEPMIRASAPQGSVQTTAREAIREPEMESHVTTASPTAALRVSVALVDELFRVSGEVSVHSAAMETGVKLLTERARALLEQNLRVQKRLFELETLVDVRALTMMRGRSERTTEMSFDPLEMDQYSELHSTAHALIEEAADARVLARHLEEEIARLGGQQTRQQRLSGDLQHLVIGTRMAAVGVLESRLQRNVRSTCQATGKLATLVVQGGDTQIDSEALSRLAEQLMHLLRNAVDHGIESPEERRRAGKPEAGRIVLSFSRQGRQVLVRCEDDGSGLDYGAILRRAVERGMLQVGQAASDDELARLILMPGFSTRDAVSEISGRGVGLDVVRENIGAMNGSIRISSHRRNGCLIELRFAASLSTMHSLIVEVAGERFALPTSQIERAVPRGVGTFEEVGAQLVYHHDKRVHPATRLADATGLAVSEDKPLAEHDAVILRNDHQTLVVAVDRLIDSRELLVKSPGRYARHLRGVAGLSILGDGGVAVNLDLGQIFSTGRRGGSVTRNISTASVSKEKQLPRVLIVDDALSVRHSLQQLVRDAGYRTETARDGADAIETLRDFKPDLVVTDLEMPNMNGVELTAYIRGRDDLKDIPVIMVTSRSQEKHRRLAEQAGVSSYLTKPYNDDELLRMIRLAIAA